MEYRVSQPLVNMSRASVLDGIVKQARNAVMYFGPPAAGRQTETSEPASSGANRPLSERLMDNRVDPKRIPALTREAVDVSLAWANAQLGGFVEPVGLFWFRVAAAPQTAGLFSFGLGNGPVIWLSDSLAGDFQAAAETAVHECSHAASWRKGDIPKDESEREADALMQRFRSERRLVGCGGTSMFVGWK
jgi:hypothetical protein